VGVQRVVKFVKYLPAFGWDCSVLTAANPSVPLSDNKLLSDIPSETLIRTARTLEPGYALKNRVSASSGAGTESSLRGTMKRLVRSAGNALLQPDAQILWRPAALREGLHLLREIPHQAIVATGPPFSSLMLGAALSRRSGVPLVLDYRDEWGISNAYWENKRQGRFANAVQSRMQQDAIRAARLLLATTPSSAAALRELAAESGSAAEAMHIYNGFDPADFPEGLDSQSKQDYGSGTYRYRLAFVGTLWNLNPIEPFIAGLKRLAETAPRLLESLELVIAGRRTAAQESALDELKDLPCAVVRQPFVPHEEACRLMQSADGLLLLNADLPDTHRIINAKTFEYMACRRPIITVAPRGDLTDVVAELPDSVLCDPGNPQQIADQMALVLERHRCGITEPTGTGDISRFERKGLAGELAAALDQLVDCVPQPRTLALSGAASP
jgi:glycosyltransferase involved in cell wall biosynthesis